ncbi:hypothetical protein [Lentzea sp. CC55]|uniref:hypothetical protein n=1 Tax=Lentzea sp. CC55 TaxID=2884909 RepID=UPI001F35B2FC|nr:hypothetical protein [Lentzea sp. CC55]MCG8922578.1 hypothetical protein [Lentzea sp. CC55]
MNTERHYDEATSKAPLDESTESDDTVPGRSGSGSVHPEPNPTGNVGLSDYSASDDPDQG